MAKAMPPVTPDDLRGGVPIMGGAPGAQKAPEIDPIPLEGLVLKVCIEGGLEMYSEQGLVGVDPANPFLVSVVEGWSKLAGAEDGKTVRYVGVMTFFTSVRVLAVTKPDWWDSRKKKFRYPV